MSWTRLSSVAVLASCSLVAAGCSLESESGDPVLLESQDQLHDTSEADTLDSYEVVPAPCLVPKTGQTVSWVGGDDGDLQQGVPWTADRFTVSAAQNGQVVTDALTGLMWPRAANPLTTARTWAQAQAGIELLNQSNDNNGYLGYTDWRLPNVNELESLVDYGKVDPALPDGASAFTGVVGVGNGAENLSLA